jgi:hypothetical protein
LIFPNLGENMIFSLIKSIIQSQEPVYLLIKYLLLLSIVFLVSVNLINSAKSLSVEHVYRKDFIQEYLLGKATTNNVDPYCLVRNWRNSFK